MAFAMQYNTFAGIISHPISFVKEKLGRISSFARNIAKNSFIHLTKSLSYDKIMGDFMNDNDDR